MKSRTKVTPELIGDIAREARGRTWPEIKARFSTISQSCLWTIMKTNSIEWRRKPGQGDSPRTIGRRRRGMEKETSAYFCFEHYRVSNGEYKMV